MTLSGDDDDDDDDAAQPPFRTGHGPARTQRCCHICVSTCSGGGTVAVSVDVAASSILVSLLPHNGKEPSEGAKRGMDKGGRGRY